MVKGRDESSHNVVLRRCPQSDSGCNHLRGRQRRPNPEVVSIGYDYTRTTAEVSSAVLGLHQNISLCLSRQGFWVFRVLPDRDLGQFWFLGSTWDPRIHFLQGLWETGPFFVTSRTQLSLLYWLFNPEFIFGPNVAPFWPCGEIWN